MNFRVNNSSPFLIFSISGSWFVYDCPHVLHLLSVAFIYIADSSLREKCTPRSGLRDDNREYPDRYVRLEARR